jgi:recombination protein RecA
VAQDIVAKRGSFYGYGDIRLGQGRENAKTFLMENRELMAELDSRIRENFGLPVTLAPTMPLLAADSQPAAGAPVRTTLVRPALDDADFSLGDEDNAPTLFDEAA